MTVTETVIVTLTGGSPWGFRLMGGGDDPLIVAKIRKKSKASNTGLEEGDIISHINNRETTGKTHQEVMEWIDASGVSLTLKLIRGDPRTAFLKGGGMESSIRPSFEVTVNASTPVVQMQSSHKRIVTETLTKGGETTQTRVESVTQTKDGDTIQQWTRKEVDKSDHQGQTIVPIITSSPKVVNESQSRKIPIEFDRFSSSSFTDGTSVTKPFIQIPVEINPKPKPFIPTYEPSTYVIPVNVETQNKENVSTAKNVPNFQVKSISGKKQVWTPDGTVTTETRASVNQIPIDRGNDDHQWRPIETITTKPPSGPTFTPTKVPVSKPNVWKAPESTTEYKRHHYVVPDEDTGYAEAPNQADNGSYPLAAYMLHHEVADDKPRKESSRHHIPGMLRVEVEPPPLRLNLSKAESFLYCTSSGSNSPKTPDSRKKKLFSDSAFYDEPGELYPTIEEQMGLCKKISASLEAAANRKARGGKMYARRKRRSANWTFDGGSGYSSEGSLSGINNYEEDGDDMTDASRISLLNQLQAHQNLREQQFQNELTTHQEQHLGSGHSSPREERIPVVWQPPSQAGSIQRVTQPQLAPVAPPLVLPKPTPVPPPPPSQAAHVPPAPPLPPPKALYQQQRQQHYQPLYEPSPLSPPQRSNMMSSGERAFPGVSPEMAMGIVQDLNAARGKGAKIFAKRKARSEKWVVDESNVKAPPAGRETTLTQKVDVLMQGGPTKLQQQISRANYKSPWEAAQGNPIGDISSAFEEDESPVKIPGISTGMSQDLNSYLPPKSLPKPPESWKRTSDQDNSIKGYQPSKVPVPQFKPKFDAKKPISPAPSQDSLSSGPPSVNVRQFKSMFEAPPQDNLYSPVPQQNGNIFQQQKYTANRDFNTKPRCWGQAESNIQDEYTPPPVHQSQLSQSNTRFTNAPPPPTAPKPSQQAYIEPSAPHTNFNPQLKSWGSLGWNKPQRAHSVSSASDFSEDKTANYMYTQLSPRKPVKEMPAMRTSKSLPGQYSTKKMPPPNNNNSLYSPLYYGQSIQAPGGYSSPMQNNNQSYIVVSDL